MTLNEALILSYVKRGIGYGYNILNHVRKSRSDEWVDFSRAGLYKTLDKLEKSGHVVKTFQQSGGRPPKKVYNITESGEEALADFLDNGFNFDFLTKNDLDAYLVTAVAASPVSSFLAGKVHRRAEAVRKHIFELENDWPEDKDQYPFIVYALYKRRKELLEHELEWLTWLENLLKSTEGDILNLTWDQATQ